MDESRTLPVEQVILQELGDPSSSCTFEMNNEPWQRTPCLECRLPAQSGGRHPRGVWGVRCCRETTFLLLGLSRHKAVLGPYHYFCQLGPARLIITAPVLTLTSLDE